MGRSILALRGRHSSQLSLLPRKTVGEVGRWLGRVGGRNTESKPTDQSGSEAGHKADVDMLKELHMGRWEGREEGTGEGGQEEVDWLRGGQQVGWNLDSSGSSVLGGVREGGEEGLVEAGEGEGRAVIWVDGPEGESRVTEQEEGEDVTLTPRLGPGRGRIRSEGGGEDDEGEGEDRWDGEPLTPGVIGVSFSDMVWSGPLRRPALERTRTSRV